MAKPGKGVLDQRSAGSSKVLVDGCVRSAAPVAFHNLAGKEGIKLRPASVRPVTVQLEQRGLVEQVHASSGRRPTAEGMQIYMKVLRLQPPPNRTRAGSRKQ